jgi:hypothetical protein
MSAWKRAVANPSEDLTTEPASTLAQRLGAGLLLQGEVVGSASRITLSATLLDSQDGRERARGTAEGPPDSLAVMIDRLAVQLVARIAGGEQLAELTSTSLPALQAYLRGQAAFRRGAHAESDAEFQRAFAADTTFALAAAGAVTNSLWMIALGRPAAADTAYARVWRLREHLSERDRALVTAIAGSRYPQRTPYTEQLQDAERAVALAPDRPDAWWWWADQLFHYGSFAGVTDAHVRARDAFVHAIELDSAHAPSLIHLTDLAANQGDTAALRRFSTALLAVDSVGDFSDFVRWRRASGLRDSTELRAIRASFNRWPGPNLARIIYYATLDGHALEDADLAATALRAKPGLGTGALNELLEYAQNRGRPQEALRITRELQRQSGLDHFDSRSLIVSALYDSADSIAAAEAVRAISAHAESALAADSATRADQLSDLAIVAEWQAWHDNTRAARAAIPRLRAENRQTVLLNALTAVLEKTPDAAARLAELDSMLLNADVLIRMKDNLVAARLHEMQGNLPAALAAARRRIHNAPGRVLVAAFLREEGRLAALTGDRDGAIRAYRHYLILRSDPEPAVKAEVERVRAELARLTAERS